MTGDLIFKSFNDKSGQNADAQKVRNHGDAQADRSPCGTGTSAKLAALYAKGQICVSIISAEMLL
uniref:proline racemase family protein n=1 Tax=Eubacterium cellulosolvens TaxID=29322 RepID=UPI000486D2AA